MPLIEERNRDIPAWKSVRTVWSFEQYDPALVIMWLLDRCIAEYATFDFWFLPEILNRPLVSSDYLPISPSAIRAKLSFDSESVRIDTNG